MVDAIEHRSINGVSRPFSLSIDATKLSPVIEALSGYKAIVGVKHPNKLIDITGKTEDQVREILGGKSDEYGKLTAATKVKATVMTFQSTPVGVSPTEIVAARP
eukprot:14131752-Ditylum_brightwellii.AAC.1